LQENFKDKVNFEIYIADVKIGGARIEPMNYGSESECATRYTTAPHNEGICTNKVHSGEIDNYYDKVKVKVNFEIYIADRKATTCM